MNIERSIIIGFAGKCAYLKKARKRQSWGHWADDQKSVGLALELCGDPETAEAYLRYCFLAARRLTESYWPEIQAVAAALLRRGTLSWFEVVEETAPTGTTGLLLAQKGGRFASIDARSTERATKAAAASAKGSKRESGGMEGTEEC